MKTKLTKTIMSSLSFTCALGCLVAAIAVGTSASGGPAPDAATAVAGNPDNGHTCSVHTLRGLYLWTFEGYADAGGGLVPRAVMQGLRFNGDGTTFNPFGTVNIGGTIVFDVTGGVGTYTVAPDCTGTLSPAPGIAPTFKIYVGPGAQQVWTLETSPNPSGIGVSVGTAVRVQ
jgi:hypothetical protein